MDIKMTCVTCGGDGVIGETLGGSGAGVCPVCQGEGYTIDGEIEDKQIKKSLKDIEEKIDQILTILNQE